MLIEMTNILDHSFGFCLGSRRNYINRFRSTSIQKAFCAFLHFNQFGTLVTFVSERKCLWHVKLFMTLCCIAV